MKYSVVTFGCRVNQADSFALERQLRAAGGCAVTPETADLVVVNSCSVTATADQGTRQMIRRVARKNPTAQIVATGCYASRAAEELAVLPGVVAVVPNDDKERLVQRLLEQLEAVSPTTASRFGDGDGACGAMIAPGEAGERRIHFGYRPAATSRAPTASFRRPVGMAGAFRSHRSLLKSTGRSKPAIVSCN